MLDSYMSVLLANAKREQELDKLAAELSKYPMDVLQKVADSKLALFCGDTDWLEKYKNTPLLQKAIDLAKAEIEQDMQDENAFQESNLRSNGRRQIELQKRMLDIELASMNLQHDEVPVSPEQVAGDIKQASATAAIRTALQNPWVRQAATGALTGGVGALATGGSVLEGAGMGAVGGLVSGGIDHFTGGSTPAVKPTPQPAGAAKPATGVMPAAKPATGAMPAARPPTGATPAIKSPTGMVPSVKGPTLNSAGIGPTPPPSAPAVPKVASIAERMKVALHKMANQPVVAVPPSQIESFIRNNAGALGVGALGAGAGLYSSLRRKENPEDEDSLLSGAAKTLGGGAIGAALGYGGHKYYSGIKELMDKGMSPGEAFDTHNKNLWEAGLSKITDHAFGLNNPLPSQEHTSVVKQQAPLPSQPHLPFSAPQPSVHKMPAQHAVAPTVKSNVLQSGTRHLNIWLGGTNMLSVYDLKVRSMNVDLQEVSWCVKETQLDVLDYSFQIYRSESVEGPFDAISVPFKDKYLFIDRNIFTGNRWRQYYYKLVVTKESDSTSVEFGPVSSEPDPDLYAMEVRSHAQLLLHEFAGRICWILPVRTFGQRCSCYDRQMKAKKRSGCITCYDTTFVRGYLQPIQVAVQIDPSAKSEQKMGTGSSQQSNTTGRIGFYPAIKPDDLIVEKENRRWKVVSVSQTEKARARIRQEFQLHELVMTDVEFKAPLVLEDAITDLFVSPERNFINPHTLESFEEANIETVMSLFTGKR